MPPPDAAAVLRQRLIAARSESEMDQLLELHRDAITPELVREALAEIPALLAGRAPIPPAMAPLIAERILLVCHRMSAFLGDAHLIADCFRAETRLHVMRGNHPALVASLEQAIAGYREMNDWFEAGRCLGMLGSAWKEAGDDERALPALEESIRLLAASGGEMLLGTTHVEIAQIHGRAGRDAEALKHLEAALDAYLAQGRRPEASPLLHAVTMSHMSDDSALTHCRRLIEFYQQPPQAGEAPIDPEVVAIILGRAIDRVTEIFGEARFLGGSEPYQRYVDDSSVKDAIEWLELARRGHALIDDQRGRAFLAYSDALVAQARRQYADCVTFATNAVAILEHEEEPEALIGCFGILSDAESHRGNLQDALQWAEKALQLARAGNDPPSIATWLTVAGGRLIALGQLDRALEYLKEAAAQSRGGEGRLLRTCEGAALSALAGAYTAVGDWEGATQARLDALVVARELGHTRGEASELHGLGILIGMMLGGQVPHVSARVKTALLSKIATSAGRPAEPGLRTIGSALLESATRLYRDIGDAHGEAAAMNDLANFLPDSEARRRLELLETALERKRAAGEQLGEAITLANIGLTHRTLGNPHAERQYLQESLEIARGAGYFQSAHMSATDLGRSHEAAGDLANAEHFYRTAVEMIEQARAFIPLADAERVGFSHGKAGAYQRLVDLLLARGAIGDAFDIAQRAKSRAILELMALEPIQPTASGTGEFLDLLQREADCLATLRRGATRVVADELQSIYDALEAFDPEYVSLRRGAPADVPRLSQWLRKQGRPVLLVDYFFSGSQLTIFFLRAGWDLPKVHSAPLTEHELWREYRAFREELDDGGAAHALGDLLTAPIAVHLEPNDLVYLVPHGLLHGLPIHAFDAGGQPLIREHAVAYAPALGILSLLQHRGRRSRRIDTCASFGVVFEDEARRVAEIFNTEAICGTVLTRPQIEDASRDRDVCHFSCHGYFDADDPMASGLVLSENEGTVLTAREIATMRLPCELVCVSACETALSRVNSGDELLGLLRAFLYGGAPSVVASLWSVDAEATQSLMESFYSTLREAWLRDGTIDKAEALRQAQIATMQRQPQLWYWAPFILAGDWK